MKQGLGLGKGIGALIPKDLLKPERSAQQSLSDAADIGGVALIDIERIISANPHQPRRHFDEISLQELAQSIVVHGVITPITVRKHFDGYELISGERRLRAARMAGLTGIPAYVLDVSSNAQMLEIALVENVQRENLNPLEVAHGYLRLIEECGLKQEDVAVKVGKDRSTVANSLRLLKLPADVQAALRTKAVSMGHARALLALSAERSQLAVLREVILRDLSVRKTETLVKDIELGRKIVGRRGEIKAAPSSRSPTEKPEDPEQPSTSTIADIENSLRHVFATQVRVKLRSDEQGAIEIDFYSLEDLERILDLIATVQQSSGHHPE